MSDFFSMGGYGNYVWLSYGLSFLVIVLNVWWAFLRSARVKRRLTHRGEQPEPARPTVRQVQ